MKNWEPPELAWPVFAIDNVPAELLSSEMNSSCDTQFKKLDYMQVLASIALYSPKKGW